MHWNNLIRQLHRWMSLAFTLAVLITSVAMSQENPVAWMTYLPLPPLALLWFTGMYLFVLPYATKWRNRRRAQ